METHIYDWLEEPKENPNEEMVRKFLDFKTRTASFQFQNPDKCPNVICFCMYNGQKLRITGASRMGDVWLAKDHNRKNGYDYRVDITECLDFSYIEKD